MASADFEGGLVESFKPLHPGKRLLRRPADAVNGKSTAAAEEDDLWSPGRREMAMDSTEAIVGRKISFRRANCKEIRQFK